MPLIKPLRGRQAEAIRNDQLVLEAAREVFARQGFDAPVAAIAEHAGVGMGSLYRRYGGKEELLQRVCILSMQQNLGAADRALRADDPWEGLCDYIRECIGFATGSFSPVAGQIQATEEMWQLARAVRRRVARVVRRAQGKGSLRADVNAIDILLLIGHFSRAFPPAPGSSEDPTRWRQLAITLNGLRVATGQRLPGPAPTGRDYETRWA